MTSASVAGEVYVANSVGNNESVMPLVAKQLKELYAHCTTDKGDMKVNLVSCVQQPDGSDCGLFASAFLFEWATASVLTSLSVRIAVSKMRPHLVQCLEMQRVIPFPKLPATRRGKVACVRKVMI